MPRISVIIPVYNRRKYIVQALDSVLEQTCGDLEILVVDDGSDDDLREVLHPYIASRNIRYLYQKNGGPGKARNTGISAAKGKYIAFLDADDLWLPGKLSLQMEYLRRRPDIRVVHGDIETFRDTDGMAVDEMTPKKSLVREGWLFEGLMLLKSLVILSSLLVEASVFRRVGLFNESLRTAEDTNLFLRIARIYRFGFVDKVLVRRRLHSSNLTVTGVKNSGTFKSLENIAELFPELHPARSPLMRKAYERRFMMLGCTRFRAGDYSGSRPLFAGALKVGFFNPVAIVYLALSLCPVRLLDDLRSFKALMMKGIRALRYKFKFRE